MKVLVLENGNKVQDLRTKEARNEGSIAGQRVLVADQKLGKTELSQNDSSLVDTLANPLNDQNSVTTLIPTNHISTTGLI